MEYFILIVLFSTSFSKSVSKTRNNFLDQLKAPLFAEFDVSNVQNYIDTQIDTRLDHINDTLDDKIEALIDNKMTVDCSNNLDKAKRENDERMSGIISDFKSLEEIVKNLTNENKQLKEDFMEWQRHAPGGYVGCFYDDELRLLKNKIQAFNVNSMQMCREHCKGYKYLGLQDSNWCLCGNDLNPSRYPKKPDHECNMQCKGNSNEICGGRWRNSIYYV